MSPSPASQLRRPPAVELMRRLGLEPDPWQVDVLEGNHPRLLLNCCRQAGKTTVVALLALAEILYIPGTHVLIVSASLRQSSEFYRRMLEFYRRMKSPFKVKQTATELALENYSRVVCLPCNDETIRGYANISLLVIDEAARVPDELYRAVRPMLSASGGRLVCLSTPNGQKGFFYNAWTGGGADWHRIEVPADRIPRFTPELLDEQRRALGEVFYRQEYCCLFEMKEGVVYPDFATTVAPAPLAPLVGKLVGGLDFGFRNPFAAIWGTLTDDGVLWLTDEHYESGRPLSHHAARLPRNVLWYADPAGANERAELIHAGFKVWPGPNNLQLGIAAVSARIENGLLRIVQGRCPHLLREARLYCYGGTSQDRHAEHPVDAHNHALAALRYLIMSLDQHRLARRQGPPNSGEGSAVARKPEKPLWKRIWDNPDAWTSINIER